MVGWRSNVLVLGLVLCPPVGVLHAQTTPASPADLAVRLAAMTAVTGYEQAVVDTVLTLLPGARRDRAGNAVVVLGGGEPRRLAACPLDETGFVVGGVRPDGWLTLRRSPARLRAPGPLFDQQLEGERVTVFGARGPVAGVVAVRSIHLTRGRASGPADPFTVDDAYLDVGATDPREVEALGVRVLSPVSVAKDPQRYGIDRLAATAAGRRGGCAALLAAARAALEGSAAGSPKGTTVVAFVVEQELSQRGLLTLATSLGPFAETRVIDGASAAAALAAAGLPAGPRAMLGRLDTWPIPTRYAGTVVETVSLGDVARTTAVIGRWIRGEPGR